ncbi:MAG: metallophosphoesterase [Phycisphaerae bacterium]
MKFSNTSKTTGAVLSFCGFMTFLFIGGCAEQRFSGGQVRLSGGGPQAVVQVGPSFKFVVLGDRTVLGSTDRTGRDTFIKNIEEINQIDPDLVISVGDLINGANDARTILAMWSEFDQIIKQCRVPFVMLPGNHDISNPIAEQIYRNLFGKTYFSFDYMNVHFIALNSETLNEKGEPIERIDDDQLQWLKDDLASHNNVAFKFVFVHRPYWVSGPGGHWMKAVHPLLAKHGVTAVFAGHEHKYMKFPRIDCVQYYITGGGGGTLESESKSGGFYHYCLVTVRPRDWKIAVIKTGSILPDNVVTAGPAQTFGMMNNPTVIEPPVAGNPFPVRTTLKNLLGEPVVITVNPAQNNNPHWKLIPVCKTLLLNADQEGDIRFDATVDDLKNIYPVPTFVAEVKGESKKSYTFNFTIPIKPVRTAVCPWATQAPKIDGKLDDPTWTGLDALSEFTSPSADRVTGFPTKVQVAYDSKNLYLAIQCHEPKISSLVTKVAKRDGDVWEDDSVEILLNSKIDGQPSYHFVFNANGVIWDGIGNTATPNGEEVVASGRQADTWTLETAIPWKSLGIANPKSGMTIGLEFVRNRVQKPSEMSQWSPTFGENDCPSQFGTLILK